MSQYGAYGYALHGADYRTILAHYYQGTALSATNPGQTVRVLLSTGRASFSGAASVSGSATRLTPATTYTVKAAGAKLTITTPAGKPVGTFAAPLTVMAPQTGPLTVPGLGTYRGSLQFSPAAGGVQTVNAVGLDDYVRGVVAAEMPSSWATAALEAQAVAARTYAITTTVGGNGYDLYSDTRSQMYGGVRAETPPPTPPSRPPAARSSPTTASPRSPTSSPPQAATPRASRTCGPARRPSRGCAASPIPTTTPARTRTTAGARR